MFFIVIKKVDAFSPKWISDDEKRNDWIEKSY